MSKKEQITELTPDEIEAERLRRRKKARRRKIGTVIDRIFGFILATCIMIGLAGLGLEYVLVKGPSPALKETFVMTMLETRRFKFIPNIFLSEAEVNDFYASKWQRTQENSDSSLITIKPKDEAGEPGDTLGTEPDSRYPADEDGDGIIFEEIKKGGFAGYMITILDPTRVFIGMPDFYGGSGQSLEYYINKYDALGGINGGGFFDRDGSGLGGNPDGLTIIDGVCYNEAFGASSFVGFDTDGILHVGYYTYNEAVSLNIVNGVSFTPILVMNGEAMDTSFLMSGVNPRTAIGQRDDGAVLMLCIDGRQAHSMGCTYQDLAEIMLDHGAVNAINLDGGSSSSMWYEGGYVNKCSGGQGYSRNLPNAFLFK